jgi:N-carbamoyl-L-amino-acid hydrolase
VDSSLPPVLAGSHLDSQPTGGKFDGVLGVLAALEVVETLNDAGIVTQHPLEIVSWTNEEGARFAPAMTASGVFAGVFDVEEAWQIVDKNGRSLGGELQRIGYAGTVPARHRPLQAAFELHIEQGPILEAEGKQIGIVTGAQGTRWYHLRVPGKESHAGTTPMELRRDPVKTAVTLLQAAYEHVNQYLPDIRLTFGDLWLEPGSINTIPGMLTVTVDLRHPETAVLEAIEQWFTELAAEQGATLHKIWDSAPVQFAEVCVAAVETAVATLNLSARHIISGAGHDAVYLARVAPTGMIFIPCEDGLSHNELENATKEDVIAGANVLLLAILAVG